MYSDLLETLDALEQGLDIGRETVKGLHNFRNSLLATQSIVGHLMEGGHFEVIDFFLDLGELTNDLLVKLKVEEKGEIHLLAEGEAVRKKSSKWIVRHQMIVRGKIKKETEHELRIIRIIESHMKKMKKLFDENEEEYIHIEEVGDIFRKLSRLFTFYLKLFKKELARLRRLK